MGGSLLWDAREREVASLRLGVTAQPAPSHRVGVAFDQTGGLSGSWKATRDGVSARLYGTVDINGKKGGNRAGAEVVYDLAD